MAAQVTAQTQVHQVVARAAAAAAALMVVHLVLHQEALLCHNKETPEVVAREVLVTILTKAAEAAEPAMPVCLPYIIFTERVATEVQAFLMEPQE